MTAAQQLYELRLCLEAGDYFLVEPQAVQSRGLRRELSQLGRTLSREARDAFDGLYGRMASDRLAAAIASRSCAELESVARLAANTDSGSKAALLLGYICIDQRQPLEAVGWLQQLADDPVVRDRYEPQISVLLAIAWSQAGMPELARECLSRLREQLPDARIRRGDQDIALFSTDDPLVVIKALADSADALAEHATDWPTYRGDPQRNAIACQDVTSAGVSQAVHIVLPEPAISPVGGNRATVDRSEVPALPALHPFS